MTSGVSLGADYCRGMIERQQRSGLSISEFCRRVEVSDFTFRRWKQRLAEAPTRRLIDMILLFIPSATAFVI